MYGVRVNHFTDRKNLKIQSVVYTIDPENKRNYTGGPKSSLSLCNDSAIKTLKHLVDLTVGMTRSNLTENRSEPTR